MYIYLLYIYIYICTRSSLRCFFLTQTLSLTIGVDTSDGVSLSPSTPWVLSLHGVFFSLSHIHTHTHTQKLFLSSLGVFSQTVFPSRHEGFLHHTVPVPVPALYGSCSCTVRLALTHTVPLLLYISCIVPVFRSLSFANLFLTVFSLFFFLLFLLTHIKSYSNLKSYSGNSREVVFLSSLTKLKEIPIIL